MSHPETDALFCRALHCASERLQPGDPVAPPIVPSSVFFLPGEPQGPYQYSRWSNPTWTALEESLGVLEDASTVVFSSGMSAVASVLTTQLKSGDSVLLPSDAYYATRVFAEKFIAPLGAKIVTCPVAEYDSRVFAGCRLVWIETPSNPGLDLCDIAAVAARAHRAGALVVADNSAMTPLGQRPLDLGADVVVSSDTKAVSGHSDVVFGHLASRSESVIAQVREWRSLYGAIPGPFEAWLVHRGLETLEVRFERMCASAGIIARRLAAHPCVNAVRFPGLASHPAHALAQRQMLRSGFLIGVTLDDASAAERFINGCAYIRPTTSFGGVHTSAERRARWHDHVAEGFVRLSIGCEPTEILWGAMQSALDAL